MGAGKAILSTYRSINSSIKESIIELRVVTLEGIEMMPPKPARTSSGDATTKQATAKPAQTGDNLTQEMSECRG